LQKWEVKGSMGKGETWTGSKVEEKSRTQIDEPSMFRVLMHNDDYTTMEFVVDVLEAVFHKTPPEANQIMLNIHMRGVGTCGIFPFEIAETKVAKVHRMAKQEGFPLRCSLERA